MIDKNLKKFKQNKIQFNDIFKLHLQDYFHPMTGFESTKFDDYLCNKFNLYKSKKTMVEVVEIKYGTKAKDLILNLTKKD